jgi:hypothetical protein
VHSAECVVPSAECTERMDRQLGPAGAARGETRVGVRVVGVLESSAGEDPRVLRPYGGKRCEGLT